MGNQVTVDVPVTAAPQAATTAPSQPQQHEQQHPQREQQQSPQQPCPSAAPATASATIPNTPTPSDNSASTGTNAPFKIPPPSNTAKYPTCTACTDREEPIVAPPPGSLQEAKVFAYMHSGCPLTRKEVGRASWAFLHTMAAYYPDQPTKAQQEDMRNFVVTFARVYPCGYCADTSSDEMVRNPPRVQTRRELSRWLCEIHNEVNDRLGKPTFDCSKVEERWRDGPPDKSCD